MATKHDGEVIIGTELDKTGLRTGIKSISGELGGLKSVLGKIGAAVAAAFAVEKVIQFGKACVELGSDLAEVQNVVDVAFGSMSDKMEQFADTAITSYGMSKLAAKKTGSNFMAMAKGMGVAEEAASDMAIGLTGLSGDVASFFNIDQEEAATKLKSVFTGETESLKEIGVVMTQANLQAYALAHGMDSNLSAMSQAQLVALRYAYVMDTLALAQGDFVRTQDSWANQTRILSMQWQEFMSIIGQALTTVLLPLVKVLNTVVAALIRMANAFNAAIQAIFGGSRKELSEGTAATDGLADATTGLSGSAADAADAQDGLADSTTAAAKAAKKSLASFDELNKLQAADAGSGGSGSSGGVGTGGSGVAGLIESEIGNEVNQASKLEKLLDRLKAAFAEGWKSGFGDAAAGIENIKADLQAIGELLREIWNDPAVEAAVDRFALTTAKALGQIAGAVASIGVSIAENLAGGFRRYLDSNKGFIKNSLTNIFNAASDLVALGGNFAAAVAEMFRSLGSEGGKRLTAGLMGVLNDTLPGMLHTFLQTLYVLFEPMLQPFIDNATKIRETLSHLFEVLAPLFEGIAKGVADFYTALNQLYQNVIKPVAEFIGGILSNVLGDFLDNVNRVLDMLEPFEGVLNSIGQVLGWLVGGISAVAAAFAAWKVFSGVVGIIQGGLGIVGGLFSGVGGLVTGFGTILSGLTGTASLATSAVSATGVATGLLSNPVGLAIAAIGALVAIGVALYANWDTIKEKAQEVGNACYQFGANLYQTMYTFGQNAHTTLATFWANTTADFDTWCATIMGQGRALVAQVQAMWDGFCSQVKALWDSCCTAVSQALSNLQSFWSGVWNAIVATVTSLVTNLSSRVQGTMNGLSNALQSGLNRIQQIFSSVWNAIKNTVLGVIDGIVGSVRSMISSIGSAISGLFDRISNLRSSASGAMQSMSNALSRGRSVAEPALVSMPQVAIPALANGAVIPANRRFLAMLGDQTSGTNIEAPLDTIKQAVAEVLTGFAGGGEQPINIYIGEELLDTVIAGSQRRRAVRSGGR